MIYFIDEENNMEYAFMYIETDRLDIAYKMRGTDKGSIWTEWNILFGFDSIIEAINVISLGGL